VKSNFKLSRVAASVAVAITGLAVSQAAFAGPGFVTAVAADGLTEFQQPTFFAYSPSGVRDTPIEGFPTTGKALRKFIDPLPLPGAANAKLMADGTTSKYIPVAVGSKWKNPQGAVTTHDYYEIAVVEYTDKFHTDLKKPTTLRGYVQIDHLATNNLGLLPGSIAYPLTYPDGTAIMIGATDANGKLTGAKVQALAVDKPHFLGPVIAATKDIPTRLKVFNLLPVGRAEVTQDLNGVFTVTKRNGDLFLPVDKSILGAGVGPDGWTEYTQNRASVHLHGGDTPWISDGTPHQWITPVGENDANNPLSLAAAFTGLDSLLDPAMLPNYLKGASTQNVPDMNDPGDGAMTLYFPNGQTARFIWYHDHTFGSTRLNVYAGMASAYLITDPVETALVNGGTVGPANTPVAAVLPPPERTIPLVLQDRTFVPDDIALQDARWNTSAWGQPGDSWFPHVYETVQDPAQANNWNAVGRWHYGPWFWPVFPALYALPEGTYSPAGFENTVTTTPEAWNDTPIVNGVAYPTMEVDPTTYRFRLLNAANDRMMTFNLFEAVTTAKLVDGTSVTTTVTDTAGALIPSEINMIPAAAVPAADACLAGDLRTSPILDASGAPTGKFCIPETWPTDGRLGGVPAPEAAGPTIYQIANEGGWLPNVATFEPTPINYVTDKGRIVVLNVDLGRSGLFLAPAERADIVVDFSQYAGKTLLVYNDSGAPVPAGDPRNDLFTGIGDQSGSGGAENTKPGYGPNTRTMMQIKVKPLAANAPAPTPLDPVALNTAISTAYFSDPDRRPIVAQDVYSGYNGAWSGMTAPEMYGDIYLGSLKNPTFTFTPGTPSDGIVSVVVTTQGGGYTVAPLVDIPAPAVGQKATAVATMKLDQVTVTNPGSGYTSAPLVTFIGGGGNGATGAAFLRADPGSVSITAQGNYGTYTGPIQASFSPAPGATPNTPAGVRATGYANIVNGKLTSITVLNPGSGYVATPLISVIARKVTFDPLTGAPVVGASIPGTGGKATIKGVVDSVLLYATDHTSPATTEATKGGGGYTDLRTLQINLRNGLPLNAAGQPIGTPATASATGKVFDVTLTHPGSGYTTPVVPTFTQVINGVVTPPATATVASAEPAATSAAKASILVKTKAIQELFDPTYGRLNATLGVELPFTSALTQTTIPLGYVDENTEEFADGETQIWKITHNGVDSHPVHFHLLNVQVINRVGWDGFIQPAEPREMGWKETVMMSPLEDIIVAVRAKKPTLPGFGVPLSQRLMDPTQPEGSPFGFTQIDPVTGNPKVVTNQMKNFGWEYVWHCHILGHEENDFMRPIIFNANEALAGAPTLAAPMVSADGTTATLSFADNSQTEYKFSVRRAGYTVLGKGAYQEIGTELANGVGYVDNTLVPNQQYAYQVAAISAAGESLSAEYIVGTFATPAAPSLSASSISGTEVALTWTIPVGTALTGYTIVRTDSLGATANFTAGPAALSFTDTTVVGNTFYSYVVTAVNSDKSTASNTATVTTAANALVAPDTLAFNATTTRVQISWVDRSTTETQFLVERAPVVGGVVGAYSALATVPSTSTAGLATAYTYNNTVGLNATQVRVGNTYVYRVTAQRVDALGVTTSSAASTELTVAFVAPTVPTGLNVVSVVRPAGTNNNVITLNWTNNVPANAPAVSSTRIQRATNAAFTTGVVNSTINNGGQTGTVTVGRGALAAPNPPAYYFRLRSVNAAGQTTFSPIATIGPVATQ
jgi:FtsP/CotA-like multicopper oxidase with cupredoxin domain